jgi:hypothetical protein
MVCMAAALTFAPQAAAVGKLKAKFKVVSASGSETLSFHEDGLTSPGERCVGTTTSKVSWRATRAATLYVFVRRVGGRLRTTLSADRVGEAYEAVPLIGRATVSRSVSYQETAGCQEQPTDCPKTTGLAKPFLTGTPNRRGSVNGGIDVVRLPQGVDPACGAGGPIAAGIVLPFGNAAMRALLPKITVSAFAVPRGRLLDPRRKRIKDSVTVKEPLSGAVDEADQATVSGTYTDHIAITLKRLKLKR